jgi:hypothetical protein
MKLQKTSTYSYYTVANVPLLVVILLLHVFVRAGADAGTLFIMKEKCLLVPTVKLPRIGRELISYVRLDVLRINYLSSVGTRMFLVALVNSSVT